MLKQLAFLKNEYKSLETKLVAELKTKSPNQGRIKRLKKLKRRAKASLFILMGKYSITRRMRTRRRSRRMRRVAYSLVTPKRYNFSF